MFQKITVLSAFLLTTQLWGQITKDQIYAMTEKGIDESVLISMVQTNCVDFEINGQIVVELAGRIAPEVLRTIVDCVNEREKLRQEEIAKELAAELVAEATEAEEAAAGVGQAGATIAAAKKIGQANGFPVPAYVSVTVTSNKSSYSIDEMEFRIVSPKPSQDQAGVRFRFTGEGGGEEEIRCYKRSGPDTLTPGEYVGYLHVVSTRKKGMMGKKIERTDLHKFFVEYKGTGPIFLEYNSKEDGAFKSKKGITLEVKGPLTFHGEEHISVEGQKTIEDLLALIKS